MSKSSGYASHGYSNASKKTLIFFPMEILSREENQICTRCARDGKPYTAEKEIARGGLKVIVADGVHVYAVPADVWQLRVSKVDHAMGLESCAPPQNLFMDQTWLRENVLSDGSKWYTFGNIFGKSSVLLGPCFNSFSKSEQFKTLIGRRLESVLFKLEDGQSKRGATGATGVGQTGATGATGLGSIGATGATGLSEASFALTQKIWVNKSGNDITGNGSLASPFLTIQRAETAITDNSATKMYNINVGSGIYDDSFNMKPWVFVIAEHRRQTVISALATIGLDPSFATAGTVGGVARTGLVDLTLNGPTNFDLQALGGTGNCRFEIWHCGINQLLTFKARQDGDGINIESSFINAGLNGSGGNSVIINCYVAANITIDTVGGATVSTFWEFANVYFNFGNLSLLSPSNISLRVNLMNVASWGSSSLTVGGTLTTVYSNGIPIRSQVSFVGGAVDSPAFFIRTTDVFSWAYTPGTATDWAVSQPFTAQQAIDRLAKQLAIIGGVPIPP